MKQAVKRLIKWLLIFVCLGLGVWTLWNLWATNKLEKVVADLRERGLATTVAELESGLPPFDSEPAEAENAAPILEAAFELAKSIGPPLEWEPGQSSEIPEESRKSLPLYDEVFELLYQAAERPRCRFDLEWSEKFAMGMIHITQVRDVARLLTLRALVRSEDGDGKGAIEDLRVLFAVSRCLREEPLLITQVVRIAVAEMGLDALRVILPRSKSAVEDYEKTSPDLATGSVARAFQGELAVILSTATDADAWSALEDVKGDFDAAFTGLARPYMKAEVAYMASVLERCIGVAGKPYPVALALADSLTAEVREEGGAVTRMMLPMISHMFEREAQHASRVELVKLGAKCIDYQHEHGEYPTSLGELKDVEPDPLTDRPFVLKELREGLLLRSEQSDTPNVELVWELGE